MDNVLQKANHSEPITRRPVAIALGIAVFGLSAMLIVDHGPWSRPRVQTAQIAMHKTTGEAARAAGASVTPTLPKSQIEPAGPGPKPGQALNPASP
jgi:hypothetical protein